jgi:hypothetical protein
MPVLPNQMIVAWGSAAGAAVTLTASYVASAADPHGAGAGIVVVGGFNQATLHTRLSADPTSCQLVVTFSPDGVTWDQEVDQNGAYYVRTIPLNAARALGAGGGTIQVPTGAARFMRLYAKAVDPGVVTLRIYATLGAAK